MGEEDCQGFRLVVKTGPRKDEQAKMSEAGQRNNQKDEQ